MADETRLAILTRVRQAQIRARIPETKSGLPARLAYAPMDSAALVARILAEFALLGVECHVEATAEGVRARVKGLITGRTILSWDTAQLPYDAGDCLQGEKVFFGSDHKEIQGAADIGLTGCENALAETGTLAMTSGPGRPRSASLMPMTHVAVIRRRDILLGMGQYFEKAGTETRLPYVVFITGPSRTADIELSLTLGVHGPGRLIAIIGP